MKLDSLIRTAPSWMRGDDDADGIVISCRARLARNLARYPFASRITEQQQQEVIDEVLAAAKMSQSMNTATYFGMSVLDGDEHGGTLPDNDGPELQHRRSDINLGLGRRVVHRSQQRPRDERPAFASLGGDLDEHESVGWRWNGGRASRTASPLDPVRPGRAGGPTKRSVCPIDPKPSNGRQLEAILADLGTVRRETL